MMTFLRDSTDANRRGGAVISSRQEQRVLSTHPSAATRYVATGSLTQGDFGLFEYRLAARTPGARAHLHKKISESFYVLEGELGVLNGEDWVTAGPGELVYVPRESVHGFRNDGEVDVAFLILFTPGAPREEYFDGLAQLRANGRTPTSEEIDEFARRHDQYNIR